MTLPRPRWVSITPEGLRAERSGYLFHPGPRELTLLAAAVGAAFISPPVAVFLGTCAAVAIAPAVWERGMNPRFRLEITPTLLRVRRFYLGEIVDDEWPLAEIAAVSLRRTSSFHNTLELTRLHRDGHPETLALRLSPSESEGVYLANAVRRAVAAAGAPQDPTAEEIRELKGLFDLTDGA